jgi:lipoprotein-anchoring transpeptidase ErfK/SrfK
MIKRLSLLAAVLTPLFIAMFSGIGAGGLVGIAQAAASSCPTDTSPGCTNGLPTDSYNALLEQMNTFPAPQAPQVSPIAYDQKEVWSYSFWKVSSSTPMYDAPNGSVITTLDGFTFVSVYAQKGDFTEIKYNRQLGWVKRNALTQTYASEFVGVQINQALPFPIAWVIQASLPASIPGGTRRSGTTAISRYTLVYLYATVKVDQWNWYLVGPGKWLPQQKVAVVAPVAQPEGATDKWVSVDLFEKVASAYEGSKLVFATLVSPGLPGWDTNVGVFKVWKRLPAAPMSGGMGQPDFYSLPQVPYVMYFDKDISLHGTYWHDGFGYNHSHGCVNLSIGDASWLYNWIGDGNDMTVQVVKGV